jgi:VanZ family protein
MVIWGIHLIGVIIGSLLPGDAVPEVIAEHDKLVHFSSYLFLSVIPPICLSNLKVAVPLGLLTIPLGLVLEIGQGFVPDRSPEVADFLANTTGVLAGVSLALAVRKLLKLR